MLVAHVTDPHTRDSALMAPRKASGVQQAPKPVARHRRQRCYEGCLGRRCGTDCSATRLPLVLAHRGQPVRSPLEATAPLATSYSAKTFGVSSGPADTQKIPKSSL
jgi:hypothetical protein